MIRYILKNESISVASINGKSSAVSLLCCGEELFRFCVDLDEDDLYYVHSDLHILRR